MVGNLIRYRASPSISRHCWGLGSCPRRRHSASAHRLAASNTFVSSTSRVSRTNISWSVLWSISVKSSDWNTSSAWVSITYQQRCASLVSSNRWLWLNNRQALLGSTSSCRCSTQSSARCGIMYFLAAYKVGTAVSIFTISPKYRYLQKQGKSEGFDSCDQPSNLTQIGFKSSIFQPVWPWNVMDDPKKQ